MSHRHKNVQMSVEARLRQRIKELESENALLHMLFKELEQEKLDLREQLSSIPQKAFNTSIRSNAASAEVTKLLEDKILGHEANVNLEETGKVLFIGDDQENNLAESDDENMDLEADDASNADKKELVVLIKIQYVYGIRAKREKGRKSLVYWGVTKDPYERWAHHKSKNNFTDQSHKLIVFYKVTTESRLFPNNDLQTNALVLETVIDLFAKKFSPCKKFKAGNGSLQSPDVKQLVNTVSKAQKGEILARVDASLASGKHMDGVEKFKCEYCSFENNLSKELIIHLNDKHANKTGAKKKVYLCSMCPDLTFDTSNARKKHNHQVHNKAPNCPECKKQVVKTKTTLKRHLINKHKYSKLEAKSAAGCKMSKQNVKDLAKEHEEKAQQPQQSRIKKPKQQKAPTTTGNVKKEPPKASAVATIGIGRLDLRVGRIVRLKNTLKL